MSVFEALMLICFGLSWPVSIIKSLRTKTVLGKSPLFMGIIILGYASGLTHKIIYSRDWVLYLYAVNLMLVAVDLIIYFRFKNNVSNTSSSSNRAKRHQETQRYL